MPYQVVYIVYSHDSGHWAALIWNKSKRFICVTVPTWNTVFLPLLSCCSYSYKGSIMRNCYVFLDASLNKLLNEQSSCRWFVSPWHSKVAILMDELSRHNRLVEAMCSWGATCPSNMLMGLLCFVLLRLYSCANSSDSLTHSLQGCFTGTGAIAWLPQCQ